MKRIALLGILLLCIGTAFAQRQADKLDRGLIAMKVGSGVYLNWRLLGEEYYDVKFDVYRNGTKLNNAPLDITNFTDNGGTLSNTYTVAPVIDGVAQGQCKPVSVWSSSYKEIKLTHQGIRSTLIPNDACCADVDGDGELEILMKFDNESEMAQSYPKNGPVVNGVTTHEYSIFEVLKLDGTRLWWVNCGPNMGDFQNNEQNIIAYDWDGDGKAEAVMRAADGTVIHMADGKTYTVGNAASNIRGETGGGTNWFMSPDVEYLVYMNGETGEPYQVIPYPLLRLEPGETDMVKAWSISTGKYDGGHRASKFFFGAPYLDGRKPSIFLARGIYTRHKMIAYDVNPTTHELVQRWRWDNNTRGPWFGQGYHNYSIADVDMDGRDEIVFGSMVIDDNGKGLSTTGFGHGDAHHVSDFNPYMPGLEFFGCNEDEQGFNYKDATTSKVYAQQLHVGKDVGRSMAGNFTNDFPGGLGTAWGDPISTVTNAPVSGLIATGVNSNFRIYWDGDLLSETFNGEKSNDSPGVVAKYGSWTPIYTCEGSLTNNYTKATPCYQGDIFGDWREEIIMRTPDRNIRIYSTPVATKHRIPTLWSDHQYRNAMVWQMCGYNQPPHLSYFLGELEGLTVAPPPLTMNGRIEVANGGKVDASLNGKHAIVCETNDTEVSLADGAAPSIMTFNVPSWVQGAAASNSTTPVPIIRRSYYTCDVTSGSLSGNGRLVKQGDGILNLPATEFTHSGETHIWGGTLNFDGQMNNTHMYLDRFATLNSKGGKFKYISTAYGSTLNPGGENECSTITIDTLMLGFGSRILVDLYSEGIVADKIISKYISIEQKKSSEWIKAGPAYLAPVIELVGHLNETDSKMLAGKYVIGEVSGEVEGNLDAVVIEGLPTDKKALYVEDGKLILEIFGLRNPSSVVWTGEESNVWDLANTQNFSLDGNTTQFVSEDDVVFNDFSVIRNISLVDDVVAGTVTVNSSKNYTFSGNGAWIGETKFVKSGTGSVTINNENRYTGGNALNGGTTIVSLLSNSLSPAGNLGAVTSNDSQFTMSNGAVLKTTAAVEMGSPMRMEGEEGGVIENAADFKMDKSFTGTLLTKKGTGTLFLLASNTVKRITMTAGALAVAGGASPKVIELQGGTLYDDGQNTTHEIVVPSGKSATWQLSYTYYTAYNNKITGSGTLTIVPRNTVSRVRIVGDWSEFEGTIKHTNTNIWLPLDASTGMPNGTLNISTGCTVTNVAKTFTIGKLAGAGNLAHPIANFQNQTAVSGSNTWRVGNSWEKNGDCTFSGKITDAGGANKSNFEKIGTNVMTISGAWDNTGSVKVSEGTLKLSGSAVLGTGELTIAQDAIMNGSSSGNLKNSMVNINGILHPGILNPSGFFSFNKQSVTVGKTGELQFLVKQASTSATTMSGTYIKNIGKLTVNGKIVISLYGSYQPKEGDEIRLWSDVTSFAGTPTIEIAGWDATFDTSKLDEGVVIVTSATVGLNKVSNVNSDAPVYYNLQGQPVANPRSGLYISKGKKIIIK